MCQGDADVASTHPTKNSKGLDEEEQNFKHGLIDYLFEVVSEALPLINQPPPSLSTQVPSYFWHYFYINVPRALCSLSSPHGLSLIPVVSMALSTLLCSSLANMSIPPDSIVRTSHSPFLLSEG